MQAERVTSFGDKRKRVRNTAEEPFAAIAHLDCGGTGFLSRIDDTFVLITAGHCLQEEELVITFGEHSPTFHPLKIRANKETFGLPSDYRAEDYSDYGIILLKDQKYFKEKNIYIPLKTESGQRPVLMSGYPGLDRAEEGVPGYPPRTQWSIQVTDCRADGRFLRYKDATTGGNSGSPLFVKQNGIYVAVGIHIAGYPDFNRGIRITKEVIDTIRSLVQSVKQGVQLKEKRKQEREKEKQEVKRTLMKLADELDEHQRGIRIAKATFASAAVASSTGGSIFALLTGRGSLVAVCGIVGGAVSGAGTYATNIAAQEAIRSVEGETGGLRAATTGITTMFGLLQPVLIGLNIAEIVYNSIKIVKKSPSEVAEQIRAIARKLD
ncbi:glutamyl endopeptidase-like isoform X2 [Haliotis rubra]|uniref:glutamyl endopeptidase-like isoform X2 n=1 Tax=Haliotis rubra TaxID=36100 RepID=UPI001EE50964|nr:glutamyl endopeptidase-like isoform X2 [Haliotis rubra]